MQLDQFPVAIAVGYPFNYIETHPSNEFDALEHALQSIYQHNQSVETWEEFENCENDFHRKKTKYSCYAYDIADGMLRVFIQDDTIKLVPDENFSPKGKASPLAQAVSYIRELDEQCLLVLQDVDQFLPGGRSYIPSVERHLKALYEQMATTKKRVVFIGNQYNFDSMFGSLVTRYEYSLPQGSEIRDIITTTLEGTTQYYEEKSALPGSNLKPLNVDWVNIPGFLERGIRAASGLSRREICARINLVIATHNSIDEKVIHGLTAAKYEQLSNHGIEYMSPPNVDLGGMDLLKDYIRKRTPSINQIGTDIKIPTPKGIVLLGTPGTGKSLAAKVISATWGLPALKFSLGALMGSKLGESEANLRMMIKMAEYVAPCILVLDEFDKAFSGINDNQGDNGVSRRMFGELISWLQEKESFVYVVATANRIDKIPEEFTRHGRFDAVFYTDLPTHSERVEILKAHLTKYDIQPGAANSQISNDDLDSIATVLEGYCGSEIQAVVEETVTTSAFNGTYLAIGLTELSMAVGKVKPQSQNKDSEFEELTRTFRSKYLPVSSEEKKGRSPFLSRTNNNNNMSV